MIHQFVRNVVLLFSDLHVLLLEDLLILLQKQDDKLVLKCLSTTFSAGYQDVKVSSSKYPSNQYETINRKPTCGKKQGTLSETNN